MRIKGLISVLPDSRAIVRVPLGDNRGPRAASPSRRLVLGMLSDPERGEKEEDPGVAWLVRIRAEEPPSTTPQHQDGRR